MGIGITAFATDVATAWLAKKAIEVVGLDLSKVAHHVVDDVADLISPVLPANLHIGRIINTKA